MPARAPRSPPCSGQKAGLRAGNPNRLKMISDEPGIIYLSAARGDGGPGGGSRGTARQSQSENVVPPRTRRRSTSQAPLAPAGEARA